MKNFIVKIGPKLSKYYAFIMILVLVFTFMTINAYAADDIWVKGEKLIKDLYKAIAGISTVLAGLMSAIAVLGAKLSNNQHKVDQAWDWLRRIWIAWAVINGIGAFIAWIKPLFDGMQMS